MLEVFKSAAARRLLIWITTAVAIILLAVVAITALFLEPQEPPLPPVARVALITTQVVAGGLFGGVAAAAFLAFISRYLFKQEAKLEKISVLDTLTTRRVHLEAIDQTEFWWHNGHIGRWVRTTVLPRFAEAVRDGGPRSVKLVVLDPLDDVAVGAYAEHRDQVDAIPDGTDTNEDARVEVLATILSAAHYQRVAGLEVEVALRSDLNLFRVDLCEVGAFTTLTRDKAPAIEYRKELHDSDHYWAAKKNFEFALASSRRVDLSVPIAADPTVSEVEDYFRAVGLGELAPLAEKALVRSASKANRTP